MKKEEVIGIIGNFEGFDSLENDYKKRIQQFLLNHTDIFTRENQFGHITVSSIIVDENLSHILLVWHQKLQRWLQPGGHFELTIDDSLHAGALRELVEETNLDERYLKLYSTRPFDLDIHVIPERKTEKEHFHFDIRFLFIYNGILKNTIECKWMNIDDFKDIENTSFNRVIEKIRKLNASSF